MIGKPPALPVRTPEVLLIDPEVGLLLLHVPPATVLAMVILLPEHTNFGPEMVSGVGLTVIVLVEKQPV